MGNLRNLVGQAVANEAIKVGLILAVPFTLFIIFTQFSHLVKGRRYAKGKLPPGPPGRDHATMLEGDRWNMFKSWNDRYGAASLSHQLGSMFTNNGYYRLYSNFLYRTTTEYG